MPLSDQEIKYLLEKAEKSTNFKQPLKSLNKIIENVPPHPFYFSMRAAVLYHLGQLDHAIEDINRAIELDSDQGGYYSLRGKILLSKLWMKHKFFSKGRKQLLEKIVTDYKVAVEKNPSLPDIWLSLIEINILLHNWDDAISIYGSCRPFIEKKEDQLIRSWLGCLALVLAGDPIEEEDKKPLHDKTIRIPYPLNLNLTAVDRITSSFFLHEIIVKKSYRKEILEKLIEIHKLLLEHFDDWRHRGEILENLGCHGEALGAYEKAIQIAYSQNKFYLTALLLQKKGLILEKLKRNKEALKTYDEAMRIAPWWGKLIIKIESFLKKGSPRGHYIRALKYLVKGDMENTLSQLSKAIEINAEYKAKAQKDEAFKPLWDDEDFKRIVG